VETKVLPGRRRNDKVISRGTIGFNGHKCGIHFAPARKPPSFGRFGTRRLRSTNGGLGLLRRPSQSNAFFAFLTLASRSSINFGIVFKLGGHGGGLLISCMNFVGFARATTIASIGNNLSLGKGSPRSMAMRPKFGTSLEALPFGRFGLNAMTKCLTMNNGMKRGLNTAFGTNSSFMPRRRGSVSSRTSRLVPFRRWPCSKALTTLGALGMFFVEDTISTLSGIGRNVTS
jgi:hypothetical protein